jgi:hypothetical protein
MTQEFISNNMFTIIQWLLGGGFIAGFFGFLWRKYYWVKPIIEISIKGDGSIRSGRPPNQKYIAWNRVLVIKNTSIYKARNIQVVVKEGMSKWLIKDNFPDSVAGDTSENCQFEIEFSEDVTHLIAEYGKDVVISPDFPAQMLQRILNQTYLLISYQNEYNVSFYTLFTIDENNMYSTFHRRKPKKRIK